MEVAEASHLVWYYMSLAFSIVKLIVIAASVTAEMVRYNVEQHVCVGTKPAKNVQWKWKKSQI